ncbi:MAG TPA: DUF5684 domain-containing protein [Actinomycetota bacterium]|nr:DUF5684 domain-containing protein [Actinomycetota bacterium]
MLKIVGRPGWWLVLYLVPIVNIVILIIVSIDLSKSFGHRGGFAVGLILLPVVFYPILAFALSPGRGSSPRSTSGSRWCPRTAAWPGRRGTRPRARARS